MKRRHFLGTLPVGFAAVAAPAALAQSSTTLVAGSGIVNVKDFGAVGDGVADDTTAIQQALDSLPTTGGTVYMPAGTYRVTATIRVGNPPPSQPSQINGIQLFGAGVGRDAVVMAADTAATRLLWDGAVGGVALRIAGPIEGVHLADFMIDGNNRAATLIESQRSFQQTIRNVVGVRWTNGFGLDIHADSPLGPTYGGAAPINHLYEMVALLHPGTGASSVRIGKGAGNLNQLAFLRCYFDRHNSATSIGLQLGYCDHLNFLACHFVMTGSSGSSGIAIQIAAQAAASDFPWNCTFFGTALSGGIATNGAWNNPAYPALIFHPFYTADGAPVPPSGANGTTLPSGLVYGTTDTGIPLAYTPISMDVVYAAATIAPKKSTVILGGSNTTITKIELPRAALGAITAGYELTIIPSGGGLAFGTGGNIAEAFSMTNYRAVKLVYSYGTGYWHRVAG